MKVYFVGRNSIPGCYNKTILYTDGPGGQQIPSSQIKALVDLSDICTQDFFYQCTLAPLQSNDVDFSFWEDRDGEKNIYFTGSFLQYPKLKVQCTFKPALLRKQRGLPHLRLPLY